MTERFPDTQCPWCNHKVNAAGDTPDDPDCPKPEPGAVLVCIRCAQPAVLTDTQTLRRPTTEEESAMAADPDVIAMVQRIRTMWAKLN